MRLKLKYILLAALSVTALGAAAQEKISREQYIEMYKSLAVMERDLYGIPACVTMAQALLESDNGNSRLAREANNHFGIKCKTTWTGQTLSHDDDAPGECFRKYDNVETSFRDHSEFLCNSPRYAELFKIPSTDYQGWAYGLKTAGYATNPNYAPQLIKIIEDYRLFLLDAPVEIAEEEEAAPQQQIDWSRWEGEGEKIDPDNYTVSLRSQGGYPIYSNNGSEFLIAREGDTYLSVATAFHIPVTRLYKINDLPDTAVLHEGEMVYLKPKSGKAHNGKLIHIVAQGETMHSVSQKYGIKLKSLARMNMRAASSTLSEGQQLRLR